MRVLLALLTILSVTMPAQPQNPDPPVPANKSAAPSELSPATAAMLQRRAETFLRNLYAWGPEFGVKADAVKAAPVPGLYEITVEVSLQGQSDSAVVYVTKDGRYMVRGEISDIDMDPFASVRQKLVLDDFPSKGPADAPVVIVEFADFQCPSCRQLDAVLRRMLPEYPQVRLVFKDFPLEQIHPWAMTAALVGRCAYQQAPATFWRVHDLIYDNQESITPETAYDKLLELGSTAGLDLTALRACVADPKTTDVIRKSMAEGANLGVTGTPTTFVNGREVIGPNESQLRHYLLFILK